MSAYPAASLLALLLLAQCAVIPDSTRPPAFLVRVEGEGNSVDSTIAGRSATFTVHSARGIGAATIEHSSGDPPETIQIELYLNGLEQLRLSSGQSVVTLAVASDPSLAVRQTLTLPGGGEQPLTPDSPQWLGVRITGERPEPPLPLAGGPIVVTLPEALIREGGGSFGVEWIDFFR